jgi:hypothetical protein
MAGNAAASASPGTAEASGAGIVGAAAHLNFEQLLQAVCDKNDPHYAAKEAGRATCAILELGPGYAASVGLFHCPPHKGEWLTGRRSAFTQSFVAPHWKK